MEVDGAFMNGISATIKKKNTPETPLLFPKYENTQRILQSMNQEVDPFQKPNLPVS